MSGPPASPMRRALAVALVLLTPLLPAAAGSAAGETGETGEGRGEAPGATVFVVSAPERSRGEVARARRIAALAESEMKQRLGLALPRRVTIDLFDDAKKFRAAAAGSLTDIAVGFAQPARGRAAVLLSAMRSASDTNLRSVLRHELCHVALGHATRRSPDDVPKWFNEGLASWFGGRLYELEDGIRRAYYRGEIMPFARLRETFPAEEHAMRVAYRQSEDFVEFIVREGGEAGRRAVRAELASGERLAAAVRRATGRALGELEAGWRRTLPHPLGFLGHLVERFSIFTLAALLALVAFGVYLRRRAKIRRRLIAADRAEAESEEPETEDGSDTSTW